MGLVELGVVRLVRVRVRVRVRVSVRVRVRVSGAWRSVPGEG